MTLSADSQKYIDALSRLLDPRTREIEPIQGDYSESEMLVRSIDDSARTVTALVSTPNPDRYEEIVEPKAFTRWLPTFMANPVFLAGHRHGAPTGEPTVLGQWIKMEVTDEGLVGTAQFDDTDPLAQRYWNLYRKKHMRAFSVGWLTHEWEMREFELTGGIKKRIRVFTEVELLECSAVSVPANRQAVARAASSPVGASAGLDNLDSGQVQKLAELLTPPIIKSIRNELALEPGSTQASFAQDIVEVAVAHLGNEGMLARDVQPEPGGPDGLSEFKRAMLGTA